MNTLQVLKAASVLAFTYTVTVSCGSQGNTWDGEILWGASGLREQTVTAVNKVDLVSDETVMLDVPEEKQDRLVSLLIDNQYLFTDQSPDVRYLEIDDGWDPWAYTDGFAPTVVRFGITRSGKKSTRIVEMHERWATPIPEYFVSDSSTRIAVVGHLRGLMDYHTDVMEQVAEAVNSQMPDYVYILGDFVRFSTDEEYDQWEAHFLNGLTAPYVFVPGNHEARAVTGGDTVFQDRIGPFTQVLTTDTVNLVAIDSSAGYSAVQEALSDAHSQVDPNKLTLLMTHHRVWQKLSSNPFMPYFTNGQFMPLINRWVDAIFAGEADYDITEYDINDGTVNVAYSIGTRNKGDSTPIYFAMVSVGPDQVLRVTPNYIDLDYHHPYYVEKDPRSS